jgi:AcrR family transcriptional regulator
MQDQGPGASKAKIVAASARDRERTMRATLSLAGEIGYNELTVAKVLARSDGNRSSFYLHFSNIGDCFAAAYEVEAEHLCLALLDEIEAASGWREETRAVLTALFHLAVEQPLKAKALLCEAFLAGGAARRKHDEVVRRITGAIGSPYEEVASAPLPSARVAPEFVVGAVEGLLSSRLVGGKQGEMLDAIPDLMFLIVSVFLGREAAECERDQRHE